MKNVSIYEKKWLDLVFEGKNKKYGAYQLRQENGKTSAVAFLFGSVFLGGFILLLSSFTEKPIVPVKVFDGEMIIDNVYVAPKVNKTTPAKPAVKTAKPANNAVTQPIPTGQMVVSATQEAIVNVPTTTELAITPETTGGTSNGTGATTTTGNSSSVLPTVVAATTGPLSTSELDRQPNYPGGMKNFYQFVAQNFDKNNLDEGETVKVKVSFVIEKNGTMTDIKVLQKTNSVIDKEAIRVLKSLRTKWSPGFKDGEPVRTQFTLPITVLL